MAIYGLQRPRGDFPLRVPAPARQGAALAVENVYFHIEGSSLSDGPTLRFTVRNVGTNPVNFYTVSICYVTE